MKVLTMGGGSICRRLLVPAHASLDTLAQDILSAFEFDNDHSYDFSYRDQRGKSRVYNHPWSDREPSTLDISVAETELGIKDKMLFTFDYGDNWQFEGRLEVVVEGSCQLQDTKVINLAGRNLGDIFPTRVDYVDTIQRVQST